MALGKKTGGRQVGAPNRKTKELQERVAAEGLTPLEVMLDNMRHFRRVAVDAERVLEGLTAGEFSETVAPGASPEDQFKFLLAQVKKTVGLRQAAQDSARDAAPYIHPKLTSVEHMGKGGGAIQVVIAGSDVGLL